MITADDRAWAKAMTETELIKQLPLSYRASHQVHQSSARRAQRETDAIVAEMHKRGMCSVCVEGYLNGDQDPEEIRTGEDCKVCDAPGCETHSKTYDRMTLSGWAHEACGENV